MIGKRILPTLISLLFFVWPTLVNAQGFSPITYGQLLAGELTPAISSQTYQFDATAGDTIYITMLASGDDGLVPVLRLFDSAQTLLTEGESFDDYALISPFEIPADGTYILSAGKADWSEAFGTFELWLDTVTYHTLDDNGSYSGNFPHALAVDFFMFSASQGELFSFSMQNALGGFGLYAPDGENLIADGNYENPSVDLFQMPQDGNYLITTQTLIPQGADYTFSVKRITPTPITSGTPFEGTMTPNELTYLTFESQAGKVWDITTEIGSTAYRVVNILLLQNRQYWEASLRYDDGSGPNGNPRITQFVAPEDGTYYLEVVVYTEATETIPYSVTITPSTVLSLVSGIEQAGAVSLETGDVRFFYAGKTGENLRIDFRRQSEAGVLGLQMVSSEDEIVNFVGRGARGASFDVVLPLDGTYQFTVWNASYDMESVLDFSLMVTALNK